MKLLNKLFNCIFKTPTNNMYKRLNNLFLYFQLMDLNEDKIVVDTIINNCLDYGVTFTFKSNLGPVHITFTKNYMSVYTLTYTDSQHTPIFEITSSYAYNETAPMLTDNLTPENISLALFELEDYLYQKYGNIIDIKKKHDKVHNRNKKLHEQALEKLYKL